jgi:peptide/nickel transport system ATP-binding protein
VPDGAAPTPILDVRNLSKIFPVPGGGVGRAASVRAVDDVSFALYPGRITALVGESGSGKSTVARLLALLYRPTSGTILFRGKEIGRQGGLLGARRGDLRYRSDVQMIFQDPFASLNPVKRIEHAVARPLEIHKVVPRDRVRRRVYELLANVGLTPPSEIARKYPHQLSGGQRQRVAIARALAVEPAVLLADEPISMLDVSIRIGVLNLMYDLKSERNIAFLYITHDIASARYIADETLVMYKGQIVEQGPTDAVMQTPLHPYTRLLLSAVPDPERDLSVEQTSAAAPAIVHPEYQGGRGGTSESALIELAPGHWVRCRVTQQKSA